MLYEIILHDICIDDEEIVSQKDIMHNINCSCVCNRLIKDVIILFCA